MSRAFGKACGHWKVARHWLDGSLRAGACDSRRHYKDKTGRGVEGKSSRYEKLRHGGSTCQRDRCVRGLRHCSRESSVERRLILLPEGLSHAHLCADRTYTDTRTQTKRSGLLPEADELCPSTYPSILLHDLRILIRLCACLCIGTEMILPRTKLCLIDSR